MPRHSPFESKFGLVRQFARYLVVGVVALGFDMGTLVVCTERLGINYLVSAAAGFLVGLTVNYILSVRWVFDVRTFDNPVWEICIFAAIGSGGLILTELLLWWGHDKLGWDYRATKLFSVVVVLFWNFGMRKWVLFRGPASPGSLLRAS